MPKNADLLFDTSDWVEIYRTTDEWEAKLIQATLANQEIRCRPEYKRDSNRQRQIALFVESADRVEAMEVVSRITLSVAEEESARRESADSRNRAKGDLRPQSEQDLPRATPTAVEEITIAEREGIGKIIHHVGRSYELQVGQAPYYTVDEDRWEEFTDFSAQRQEFSILLKHEYPNLFQWLKQEKLMAEFIRLVESTYREVPPPRPRTQPRGNTSSSAASSPNEATEAKISGLAKFSLWVSLVSLTGILFHLPWYASLTLSLIAALTGFVAKYQIDTSDGALKGSLIAFLAIIIACVVIAITWRQHESVQPVPTDLQQAHLRDVAPYNIINAGSGSEVNLG